MAVGIEWQHMFLEMQDGICAQLCLYAQANFQKVAKYHGCKLS